MRRYQNFDEFFDREYPEHAAAIRAQDAGRPIPFNLHHLAVAIRNAALKAWVASRETALNASK